MKILFVCRKFDRMAGGVERMAVTIMNEMVGRGFEVALLTWDDGRAVPHYDMAPQITWTQLGMGNPDAPASWRLRCLRQVAMRRLVRRIQPNVVIAFQSGAFIAIRLAVLGLGQKVVAAERNSPDLFRYRSNGHWLQPLTNMCFLLAWRITVQLQSYVAKYPFWLRRKIVVIPNPVFLPAAPACPNHELSDPKIILNVGRLSYQKNQVLLLHSFKSIAEQYPDWRLALVGDGEYRDKLLDLVDQLGLSGRVIFAGAIKDVQEWYRRAAFFAFPSLWEGFPNALAEALSQGIPAIGCTTTAGVNELIKDGETGLLSEPTAESFSEAMRVLIENPDLRQRMGRAAARSLAHHEPGGIFNAWETLFRSAGGRS